jgi:hypothetical protein
MSVARKTDKELDIVREEIRNIFNSWHVCKLSKKEAKENNVLPGSLCDMCEDSVRMHMANIRKKLRMPNADGTFNIIKRK